MPGVRGEREALVNWNLQHAPAMNFIVAGLVALCLVAVVFVVHLRGRGRHDWKNEAGDPCNPNKIDTTLGEFHDMRQALRPLQHTRAASRRAPWQRT